MPINEAKIECVKYRIILQANKKVKVKVVINMARTYTNISRENRSGTKGKKLKRQRQLQNNKRVVNLQVSVFNLQSALLV